MYIYIYIYIYLPLNSANNKQQQQATTSNNTSPWRFGHCSVPTLPIICPSSHHGAQVVALPNPSFELETHRWRPGAVAPSGEVPFQICAVLGQKQPFFTQNSPSTGSKQPKEGKWLLHSTCGLTFPRPRDLWYPLTPRYVRETAQKGAKKAQKLRNVHQHTETKNGPYLGLRCSKRNSVGTQSTRNPPLFMVSEPQNCPTIQNPRTSGHLVQPEGRPAHARGGQRWVHQGPRGEKNDFFQSCS